MLDGVPDIVAEYERFKERDRKRKWKPRRGRKVKPETEALIDTWARLLTYSPELTHKERAAKLGFSGLTEYWHAWTRKKYKIFAAQRKLVPPIS